MNPPSLTVLWCHLCPLSTIAGGRFLDKGVACNILRRTVGSMQQPDPLTPPDDCPLRAGDVVVKLSTDQ